MDLYQQAKGEFCQLMAESEQDLRETAAKLGMDTEETEEYVEEMIELFNHFNIALMRLWTLALVDEPARLNRWTEACNRLETEFIIR